MDFEQAKAFLQKDSGGSNLYDHLSDVLLKIIKEKPENGVEVFEHLSNVVKQQKFVTSKNDVGSVQTNEAVSKLAAASVAFNSPQEGEGAPVQDLMAELDGLEWAGVSIGREDAFRLYQNIKKLSASSGASGLRFWGKILGRGGDYYIAEGTGGSEGEEDPAAEVGGPNKTTFWVTSSPAGEWTQLPKVTPAQILAARPIKRYFTGSLNAKVGGHPPFPGKENNFLRAQIARINAATAIAPADTYAADESDPMVVNPKEDADITAKEAADLADAGAWQHLSPELSVQGRYKKEEKVDADGNPIDDPSAGEEVPPLRSLAEDREGLWVARTCGGGGSHSLAVLKSQIWPGAVAVGVGKRFSNIYIGYGIKFESKAYTPQPPPNLMAEFEDPDLVEQKDVLTNPDIGNEEKTEE